MNSDVAIASWYPDPPATVWNALVDAELLGQWFMANDFEPVVGRVFHFRATPVPTWDGVVTCKVLVVELERRLVYSWSDSWRWAPMPEPTIVTWSLHRERGGTRLHLAHTGFTGVGPTLLSKMLSMGWGSFVRRQLPRMIASLTHRDAVASPQEV